MAFRNAISVGALALAACATVQSKPASLDSAQVAAAGRLRGVTQADSSLHRGLNYFLPKRDAKLTIERKLLKKEDLQKELDGSKAKLTAAEQRLKDAKTGLEEQERLLPTLAASSAAAIETEKRRAIFAGQKLLAEADVKLAQAAVASAEANMTLLLTGTGTGCAFSYNAKLELLPAVADFRHRFVANFSHNIMRDDEQKLVVTSEGLLTSANATATDRTGDIIVEIANAISSFGALGSPTMALDRDAVVPTNCSTIPLKFSYRFDPADPTQVNAELEGAGYPFRVQVTRQEHSGYRNPSVSLNRSDLTREGRGGALFYATPAPVVVTLRQCRDPDRCVDLRDTDPIDAAIVTLPQLGPVSSIPMRSSAFVKTVSDVQFENGVITSWSSNRPSEALEVVRLPVRILTAILSAPAQIFSLRVNVSDKEKGLAAAQIAQMEQQTKLTSIRECVAAAERAETQASNCFED